MNLEEFKKILDDNIDDIVDRIVIRLEKETKESEDFIAPFVGKGVRLINSVFPKFDMYGTLLPLEGEKNMYQVYNDCGSVKFHVCDIEMDTKSKEKLYLKDPDKF